jgi:hypothetical protein
MSEEEIFGKEIWEKEFRKNTTHGSRYPPGTTIPCTLPCNGTGRSGIGRSGIGYQHQAPRPRQIQEGNNKLKSTKSYARSLDSSRPQF